MADIKTKPKGKIKKIDKDTMQLQKVKNRIIKAKEKINENTSEENSNTPENYASNKIQSDINYVSRKGTQKAKEIGNKSIKEIKENIKLKQSNKNRNVKISKNTKIFAKKEIKTAKRVTKSTEQTTRESLKLSQKAIQVATKTFQNTVKGTKAIITATVKTIKSIVVAAKSLISLIIAGGWIAIIIILIIAIIGGFIASIYNSSDDTSYDTSQISNNEMVLVAKTQIGNEGGEKFWSWYGFSSSVEWCACFVSWCANECGYIEKEIIPKFSVCTEGIKWFKERNQWQDRGEDYYPIIGDIIFFDWKDDGGNQDGISDHVGIVTRTDITNRTIYTIEGNTSNKCAERMYSFDDVQIMGYGMPQYE